MRRVELSSRCMVLSAVTATLPLCTCKQLQAHGLDGQVLMGCSCFHSFINRKYSTEWNENVSKNIVEIVPAKETGGSTTNMTNSEFEYQLESEWQRVDLDRPCCSTAHPDTYLVYSTSRHQL